MATLQNVMDLARKPLNDSPANPAERRYSDDDHLLPALKSGLLTAFRKRPDLYIGNFAAVATIQSMTASSTFPLPDEYIQPLADYVSARAELVDDEYTLTAKAEKFYNLFLNG